MCGIMGYVTVKPELAGITDRYISILARNLLEAVFERGKDATGYLAHYNNTHKTIYYKQPINALTFIQRGYTDFKVTPDVFIGHTRAATSGNPRHNENNHPLFCGDYGLVHNGCIGKWATCCRQYTPFMQTETDSELLVIYMNQEQGNLKKLSSTFPSATFALVAMNIKSGLVTLACDEYQPLCYIDLSQHLGIILFASTELILEAAMKETFKQYPAFKVQLFEEYMVYTISLDGLKTAYPMTHIERPLRESFTTPVRNITNTHDVVSEVIQIQRVELEVRELFEQMLGTADYRYHLAKFAQQYYFAGDDWLDRSLDVNTRLAETFIEDIWDQYGEYEENTTY